MYIDIEYIDIEYIDIEYIDIECDLCGRRWNN